MATSKVLSMRLREEQMARLQRVARRLGRTPSETAALLLEEGLREAEFADIEFRDSPVGRQPYIAGSRLAVWQVISLIRSYEGDISKVAEHLGWLPLSRCRPRNYAQAFPQEIEDALQDNQQGIRGTKAYSAESPTFRGAVSMRKTMMSQRGSTSDAAAPKASPTA